MTWRTDMKNAPDDGTRFFAALAVYNAGNKEFSHWDVHVIACDDGVIPIDLEQGWDLEDYERWMPIPELGRPSDAR